MLYETASQYIQSGRALLPFLPYAVISDRGAWDSLDPEWRDKTVALGESFLHFSWPYLSATDFLDFSRTGNRVRFEDRFFAKRHALDALVLAECVENKGRFLDDIINGIFSICDENAWNLPPHNSYRRDAPQLPLPDLSDPVLDLFACETGAVLATAVYLLSPVLDGFSPYITRRVRYELRRRIFTPYLTRHFWWMGDGRSPMNNWTIWCTQNVLLSAFLAGDGLSEARKQRIFRKGCRSADYFLAEYGDDGCCDEGAQYYRHAGLCLFQVLDIADAVTGGAFSALAHQEKIRNIASYIYKVHIDDKYYINFADCSPVAGRAGVREYLFGKLTGQPEMMRFAADDFLAGGAETLLRPEENNLYYRLQNGFTAAEIRTFGTAENAAATGHTASPAADAAEHAAVSGGTAGPDSGSLPASPVPPDVWFPSVGLFAVRDAHLFLAVKAGDNADSHNHNDTGSFTVYRDGRPLFIDVGVESYTGKTFSARRYEIWTMQSAYHNLPTIDGYMQHDGETFRATQVSCSLSQKKIGMELKCAYPAACGIASYRRCAQLTPEGEIIISDRFSFTDTGEASDPAPGAHEVVLSLMTYEKPELLSPGCIRIGGSAGTLLFSGADLKAIEEIPITDARLQGAWTHEIYRILLRAAQSAVTLTIR